MPQNFGSRAERRAFSRDAVRHFAAAQHRAPQPVAYATDGTKRKLNPTRAERRAHGWRGDISALIHGPHDRAWLYSGTPGASGQARINAKRNARAEYWRTVRVRVSGSMEPYFRATLHLLGPGVRIQGRTVVDWIYEVDLHVHILGAPADAVSAVPVYRTDLTDDTRHQVSVDHIEWFRADHSRIDTGTVELAGAAQ